MSRKQYTHVQILLPEIRAMEAAGKNKREIAECLGLRDKYVGKQLLTRERRKEKKIIAGIMPRPKGLFAILTPISLSAISRTIFDNTHRATMRATERFDYKIQPHRTS